MNPPFLTSSDNRPPGRSYNFRYVFIRKDQFVRMRQENQGQISVEDLHSHLVLARLGKDNCRNSLLINWRHNQSTVRCIFTKPGYEFCALICFCRSCKESFHCWLIRLSGFINLIDGQPLDNL